MNEFGFTPADWDQGLSILELIAGMTVNKEAMERRYHSIRLLDEEKARLSAINLHWKLLVMTEEWCSDCLMNLPILARVGEAAPNLEVRFFVRKEWPALRAYFNGRDIYSLPTVQVMDNALQPVGVWVERPQAAHKALAEWKESHPEVENTRRRADLTSDQKREMLRKYNEILLGEMEGWYAQRLQSETVREVTEMLKALGNPPQRN